MAVHRFIMSFVDLEKYEKGLFFLHGGLLAQVLDRQCDHLLVDSLGASLVDH